MAPLSLTSMQVTALLETTPMEFLMVVPAKPSTMPFLLLAMVLMQHLERTTGWSRTLGAMDGVAMATSRSTEATTNVALAISAMLPSVLQLLALFLTHQWSHHLHQFPPAKLVTSLLIIQALQETTSSPTKVCHHFDNGF